MPAPPPPPVDSADAHVLFSGTNPIKPVAKLAKAVQVLLGLYVVVGLVDIWVILREQRLWNGWFAGDGSVTVADLSASDNRVTVAAIAVTLVVFVTAIVFIAWFRRLYANLPRISYGPTKHKQWWATGGWLIPFVAYWRPIQMSQEIYQRTRRLDNHHSEITSDLITAWWGFWVVPNTVAYVFLRNATRSPTAGSGPYSINTLEILISVGIIIAAILGILVVRLLTERHDVKVADVYAEEARRFHGAALNQA